MKLISTVIIFIFSLFVPPVAGTYYDILRVVFNNGNPSSCTTTEWNTIDTAIYNMAKVQRKLSLRGGKSINMTDTSVGDEEDGVTKDESEEINTSRELYPNSCANSCAGFAPKTCKALNCIGYRRALMDIKKRELFWASGCNNQITEMNNLITNMRNGPGFTTNCKNYLALSRKYECFTTQYC